MAAVTERLPNIITAHGMNPTAIYSKSGKGVQEASGKTSLLKRPDRAVLAAIDGRATVAEVAQKVGRPNDPAFQALIQQLDKEGFIREVSSGSSAGAPSRPAAPASRPAAPASRPPAEPASDLDFSSLGATKIGGLTPARPAAPPSRPAAPPPAPSASPSQQVKAQMSALDKAREEAEAKAAAEKDRLRREVEEKARIELEFRMRAEAEKKMKEEAEARAKAEAEAKVKAAREAAARAAAEAKAKVEAEAKAKLEAERKAREELERRLEEERRAREEAERKAKEEAERARREAEEKARREAEELRQRLEAERKAREEAERRAREEAERKAKEEAERVRRELEAERQRLEEERRREEEERAERRRREEEERQQQEAARAAEAATQAAAAAQEAAAQAAAQAVIQASAPKAEPPKGDSFADSLLSDLDSFINKDDEEQKARAEAERQAKEQGERRRLEAEQELREEARRREEEDARRRDEERRKAREEEERLGREEERRRREAEEIQRKAEAATAAAMAKQAAAGEDDIPLSEDDLDMTEVKKERKALGIDEKKLKEKEKEAERAARKRKRADEKRRRQAEKEAAKLAARTAAPSGRPRPRSNWGKRAAVFLILALVVAVGAAHVVPLEVAEYEQAAAQALGQPVKIGSARLWLFTGPQVRFENVRVGDVRIARVFAHPSLISLLGDRTTLSLVELEGATLSQAAFGEALFSRLKTDRFWVERIRARQLTLAGGLVLPKPFEADIALDSKGAVRSATLHGPDTLYAQITPKGDVLQFEATAGGFPLPIAPEVVLSQFAMKGTATRHGMDISEWGGAIFNGGISGTARVRWGSTWDVEGVVTVRSINAAVFAPALLSEGTAEGTGRFSMNAADPAKLVATTHLDGRFSIGKGILGSFDLSRAIQSRGKQVTGTTQFAELNGQVVYDRGLVALRNVTIGAGALNAGASADIAKGGALSGRIVADVKTAAQTLSATLNLGGTVKEPQVRD